MKIRVVFVQTLFLLLSFSLLYAQPPYNQEFLVSTFGNSWSIQTSITSLLDGGFVIGWANAFNNMGIFAQRYDKNGESIGGKFQVNTYTVTSYHHCVTSLLDGGFIFGWASYNQDPFGEEIFAQRFDKNGVRVGGEVQINTYSNNYQGYPCVTSLSDSGFVFGWVSEIQDGSGYGIFAQRYDKHGEPIGSEFQVNTYSDSQRHLCVTSLVDSGFVFGWEGWYQDGSGHKIFAQRYDKSGVPVEGEFQVNTTGRKNYFPCIASLVDGGFVFGWNGEGYQDGSSDGVFAQRYDKHGKPIGGEFKVNTSTHYFYFPCVTNLLDGGFMFGWDGRDDEYGSSDGVFAQRYDKNGEPMGSEFKVNTYSQNSCFPHMTSLSEGGFVLELQSRAQDGFLWEGEIFVKYYLETPIHHTLVPFQICEPLNDATIDTTRPSFEWQEASDVRRCYPFEIEYCLLLSSDPDFSNFSCIDGITDTTYVIQSTLQPGTTYFWKVLAKSFYGDSLWSSNVNGFYVSPDATDAVEEKIKIPEGFALEQNYPNPFNPSTEIKYSIPITGFVMLKIYDIQGRRIRVLYDGNQAAGSYSVHWDGKDESGQNVSSGIYVYKLSFKNSQGQITVITRKMGLVR